MKNLKKYISEHIRYEKSTGLIFWKKEPGIGIKNIKDRRAGTTRLTKYDRYFRVKLLNKKYLVHRVIWLLEYGVFPSGTLDHINGDRSDNRIENLREVSHFDNMQNRENKRLGKNIGVLRIRKSWGYRIQKNGKTKIKSGFKTEQDAVRAREGAFA